MEETTCRYPNCKEKSAGTFALVPLCEDHLIDVNVETTKYYGAKNNRNMRVIYQQIEHLIPWSQFNLEIRKRKRAAK